MRWLADTERFGRLLSRLLPLFLVGYLALSYPQTGTSFEDGFLVASFGLILLIWAGDPQCARNYLRRMAAQPIGLAVGFLFVWGLAAALVAGYRFGETALQLDIFRKVMIKGLMAFTAITGFCHRRRDTRLVFVVLAVVGLVACVDVLVGYGAGFFSVVNRDAVRTLLHKRIHVNLMSLKLNFVAPFFMAWVWLMANRRGLKWPVYAAGVLVLVSSFSTISRAGWLGGAAGVFLLLLYARSRKALVISIMLCVSVFGAVYVASKDVRMHVASLSERLPTMSERLSNWELCVRSMGQRPLWGWGVFEKETFHRMVRVVDGPASPILKYQFPHNVLLGMALMWGIPFLAVLVGLFAYLYWKGWLESARSGDRRLEWAALAGGTFGAFWINGMFGEMIWPNLFIALALGCSLIITGGDEGEYGKKTVVRNGRGQMG